MAAWTPADLGSNLWGWFDGADAATVTITGSGVSQWVNKGASTFTLTQGVDNLRPTYAAQSLTFVGSQNLFAGNPFATYDLLVVGQPHATGDWRNLLLSVGADNTILVEAGTGRCGTYTGAGFFPAGGLTWADGANGLSYGQIASGPVVLSRDGGAPTSTGAPAPTDTRIQGLGSSGSFDQHQYGQGFGQVYEVVFVPYNSPLDTRQKLEGYAAWKWGLQALLPTSHPYYAGPPTVAATVDLAGALTPSLAFAADPTIVTAVQASKFGDGAYGVNHYSRVDTLDLAGNLAPVVTFRADLDIIGQDFFDGDLRPVVTFAGALSVVLPLAGGLAPQVTFAGTLGLLADLSGDLAPQIILTGDLTLDLPLQGDLPLQVDLAAPTLISGPLWAGTEPCPSPPWTPSEPCPPSMWTPVPPPQFVPPSGGWTEPEKVDDLPVWGNAKK